MKPEQTGRIHPLSDTIRQISQIFIDLGFQIADGPYLEDTFHNFDALNVPSDHPSRDMQDTFYIKGQDDKVLRTHTSSIQIRFMEELLRNGGKPPFKIISPGMVFRNEATDATHGAHFYQVEGLVVGHGVSLANLKWTLEHFIKKLLGDDVELRLRPGFFPFVEPGVEVDLKFQGKWMEVLGAGMVHPNVFRSVGIDPQEYSGFAFGVGIDRIMMMKYGVPDMRYSYQGDLRLHFGINKYD